MSIRRAAETRLPFCSIAIVLSLTASAQSTSFDVISIKPNTTLSNFAANPPLRGGRLHYTNVTVKEMLSVAYPVDLLHMSGGPAWLDTDHYDVEATTTEQPVSEERYREMVRSVLSDRFKLAVRYETQVQPIYALVPDRKGAKLKPAPDGLDRRKVTATHFESPGITMAKLAESLTFIVGREVVDKTGLAGKFDVRLDYRRDNGAADPDGPPSIFTAVQEQLGLRFESQKGPVQVLIIEHAEKPTEN
jgi:uncharacterized protein (TIGR03435 family)